MSHISIGQAHMVEEKYLKQALSAVGLKFEDGPKDMNSMTKDGWKIVADIAVSAPQLVGGWLAWTKNAGVYQFFYPIENEADPHRDVLIDLVQSVNQRYSYYAALDKLMQQGFQVAVDETSADKSIHLVLRRMA